MENFHKCNENFPEEVQGLLDAFSVLKIYPIHNT